MTLAFGYWLLVYAAIAIEVNASLIIPLELPITPFVICSKGDWHSLRTLGLMLGFGLTMLFDTALG